MTWQNSLLNAASEVSKAVLALTMAHSHPPVHTLEDAFARCKCLGMRLSKQRRAILTLLWESQEHLSARAIYDRLNREGCDIGHTSVYQNLEALSESQIIECVERSDARLYGHLSTSHSHVNCTDTDQIIDVDFTLPEQLIREVEARTGVKISDYRVDFYGTRQPTQSVVAEP